MAVRLSALRTPRTLVPRNIIIFMFLVLISVKRLIKPQGLVRPEELGQFKNHLIWYRTRDLPVCSIVQSHIRKAKKKKKKKNWLETLD
jgi:hypothetical protein